MTLAIIAPPKLGYLLDPVLQNLEDTGVAFDRFATVAEIIASPKLGSVTILVTLDCPSELIDRAASLEVILNPVTGCDLIDLAAAAARGIPVGIGQVAENYEGMAEGTFLLILATLYDLPRLQDAIRTGQGRPLVTARILRRKTVGLVGYGRIGRALAERLAGWQVRLLISSRTRPDELPTGSEFVEIDELLGSSDIVVILCALNDQTRNLIDERRIGMVRDGAILVNTARGGIVDEDALHAAVERGAIAGVGIDVFREEPLPNDSALRTLKNAILTPHMIGHTIESQQALRDHLLKGIQGALAGHPPAIIAKLKALDDAGQAATL